MASPITRNLPHDLPENWVSGQTVSPNGTEVGLAEKYGYNYLSKQINEAQLALLEIGAAWGDWAPKNSPAFTGTPTAPTAAASTNNTQIATTAFVKSQGYAPLASPALTGTPTAPTAAAATNNAQIATTGFVKAQGYTTNVGTITGITMNGSSKGTSGVVDLGTVITAHQSLSAYAPKASPALTGTPTAPTAAASTNTTQIATTAFVKSQGYTSNVGTITGIKMNGASKGTSGVVDLGTVITAHQSLADYAPKASPALTGTPTAPTAAAATNNTQIATTKFVRDAISAYAPNGRITYYTGNTANNGKATIVCPTRPKIIIYFKPGAFSSTYNRWQIFVLPPSGNDIKGAGIYPPDVQESELNISGTSYTMTSGSYAVEPFYAYTID